MKETDLELRPLSFRIESCTVERQEIEDGVRYDMEAPVWVADSKTGEPLRLVFTSWVSLKKDNRTYVRKWVFDELVGYARHEIAECLRRSNGKPLFNPHPRGEGPLLREIPLTAPPEPKWDWAWLIVALLLAVALGFCLGRVPTP